MIFKITLGISALLFSTSIGFSETINLRETCRKWEAIPANETLNSPVAALLQCEDSTHSWMALQIVCIKETAEIKYRYKPSYPINTPVKPSTEQQTPAVTVATDATPNNEAENQLPSPTPTPLGKKEMLFFDFPKLGVTSVVNYDFGLDDWSYTEKEPLAPLFRSLITGNYADVSLLATGKSERLPLRGSTKAIGPVVETCRIAKRKLDKEAARKSQN